MHSENAHKQCRDDRRILRQMNEDFKVNFQNSVRQEFVRRRLLPLGEGCGDGVLSNKEKKTLLCAFSGPAPIIREKEVSMGFVARPSP